MRGRDRDPGDHHFRVLEVRQILATHAIGMQFADRFSRSGFDELHVNLDIGRTLDGSKYRRDVAHGGVAGA